MNARWTHTNNNRNLGYINCMFYSPVYQSTVSHLWQPITSTEIGRPKEIMLLKCGLVDQTLRIVFRVAYCWYVLVDQVYSLLDWLYIFVMRANNPPGLSSNNSY